MRCIAGKPNVRRVRNISTPGNPKGQVAELSHEIN